MGRLDLTPNIPNAIPGRVSLSVDFRDPQEANLDRALANAPMRQHQHRAGHLRRHDLVRDEGLGIGRQRMLEEIVLE